MIVRDPPYDLVALFADDDAQRFFERVIERGQEARCLRKLRWASVSDPMHDSLCKNPERELAPFVRLDDAAKHRYLLLWDRDGSGCEDLPAQKAEEIAVRALGSYGVLPAQILAIAIEPEFEAIVVGPALERTIQLLAARRNRPAPSPADILQRVVARLRNRRPAPEPPTNLAAAASEYPKEVLQAVCACLQIPYSPVVFHQYLGPYLPLSQLKHHSTFARLTAWLVLQFPWEPSI